MTKSYEIFGSWSSPIDSNLVTASSVRLSLPLIRDDTSYWVESRPKEQGRNVIVSRREQEPPQDMLPPPYSAYSKVHEYGGGAYTVDEQSLWFVNQSDQKICYLQRGNNQVHTLFGENCCRYADLEVNRSCQLLLAIEEDHRPSTEPSNRLIGISLETGSIQLEISGADFYSTPRLSPDGKTLAWLQWHHPQMPWDGTELYTANLSTGGLADVKKIAGGPSTSIFQPEWGENGKLYYASDITGWWCIYEFDDNRQQLILSRPNGEFGLPQWAFGMRIFGLPSPTLLVAAYTCQGSWYLIKTDLNTGQTDTIDQPFTSIAAVSARDGRILVQGGNSRTPSAIISIGSKKARVSRVSGNPLPDPSIQDYLSQPTSFEFSTTKGQNAYALFYPPTNPDFLAPRNSQPPLLVKCHSGPTGAAENMLDYRIQYWTSRGYSVLDVNYRGSTGYGRSYRETLNGLWGVVDVEDCLLGAKSLIKSKQADPNKTAISGSSAGGFTVLCALTFHNLFKVGASIYGVGDLDALTKHTHKFESRYLHNLIGPYPEQIDLYKKRSPINNYRLLDSPVILFQGSDDEVVPPEQSQAMYESLLNKGLPCCYMFFEQEAHGFRKAATQKAVIDGEYAFYTRLFGLNPGQPLLQIPIANFD